MLDRLATLKKREPCEKEDRALWSNLQQPGLFVACFAHFDHFICHHQVDFVLLGKLLVKRSLGIERLQQVGTETHRQATALNPHGHRIRISNSAKTKYLFLMVQRQGLSCFPARHLDSERNKPGMRCRAACSCLLAE